MKVAILFEALVNRGGGERVALTQALHYNADIYTAAYNPEQTFPEFKKMNVHVIMSSNIRGMNHFRVRHAFLRLNLQNYDLIIGHHNSTLEAARKNHPFLWYCHAPSRWSHDLYKEELSRKSVLMKIPFMIVCTYCRWRDAKNIRHVDAITVNSYNVKKRLQQYYPLNPAVIHPPIDIHRFKWISQKDFYLSTARLDPIKRVDLIVDAFKLLPDKKIIIASSGPEEQKLKKLAEGYTNIVFFGRDTDEQRAELYGTCIALLSPSHKEDFGIIPIEANSAGKPVIATNEGGYQETVINGKTGILIDEPVTPHRLAEAVKKLSPEKAKSMREDCEKHAITFSAERFNKEMDALVKTIVKKTKNEKSKEFEKSAKKAVS